MRKTLLITLSVVAALSMVSCKNNKKAGNQEPTQEEIQAQKQALADSVLAKIDALAERYIEAKENTFTLGSFKLTESEKMVKPDYLLDPSEASKFVTKTQKVNALAVYLMEMIIRNLYDMPVDETKEAIARLSADINYPVNFDIQHFDESHPSERIRAEYDKCKENGDIALFWQFQQAVGAEQNYLMAQNPSLFFNRLSEDQWQAFFAYWESCHAVVETLAEYDTEMAALFDMMVKALPYSSAEEYLRIDSTKDSAMQYRAANKDKFSAVRNAMLQ